jgi:hypothetical protein
MLALYGRNHSTAEREGETGSEEYLSKEVKDMPQCRWGLQ